MKAFLSLVKALRSAGVVLRTRLGPTGSRRIAARVPVGEHRPEPLCHLTVDATAFRDVASVFLRSLHQPRT